jgi:hypothetical protein
METRSCAHAPLLSPRPYTTSGAADAFMGLYVLELEGWYCGWLDGLSHSGMVQLSPFQMTRSPEPVSMCTVTVWGGVPTCICVEYMSSRIQSVTLG